MNAVEIEEAITNLADQDFDAAEFPFAFLEAFGNKATTIKRLRSKKGSSNASDIEGGAVPRHRRFFSKEDELFHVSGKTYILTNQWGRQTLEAVELLKNRFDDLEVSVVPVRN